MIVLGKKVLLKIMAQEKKANENSNSLVAVQEFFVTL
jgi:hypothetical protein